jgi:uncharacterized protein YegP (UPF0339 family)
MNSVNVVYRFEYFPGTGGWYVRLRRVENAEILMVSEAYTRRWSAKRAATRMARAFVAAAVAAAT